MIKFTTKVSTRVLIPMIFTFPRRQESRKVAHCARSMGARTQLIILVRAISKIRMELYKRVSVGKQLLDREATGVVRKKLLIPLRKLWYTFQN